MERVRNFHDGALAKLAVAAAFMGGTTATEMAVNPNPVSADTAPATVLTPEQQQQCIDDALALPETRNPIAMYRAGIRPLGHSLQQTITGSYGYEGLPSYCGSAGLERVSLGDAQIYKNGHWTTIVRVIMGHIGNQQGITQPTYSPPHALPAYQFNDAVKGKDGYHFHKMRILLDNKLKQTSDRSTVAEKKLIIPMEVHGKYGAAIRSKHQAEKLRK